MVFLAYHWLGFWIGWFRFVLPSLIKNRACVGDRYAWEFFLDPMRLRLQLPSWILKLAARTVPSPSITIGLYADPSLVVTRKHELPPTEVAIYQTRMQLLSNSDSRWVTIDAGRSIDEVVASVKNAIVATACK
jgi:thymidylate kinase